jgi:hypothetical protein
MTDALLEGRAARQDFEVHKHEDIDLRDNLIDKQLTESAFMESRS